MKTWTSWMLMCCLLGWIPVAGAQPGSGAIKKRVMREIGLSHGQIQKVMDLTFGADRAKVDIRASVQKARMDLQQLMASERPQKAKVFAQIEVIGKLEVQLHKNRIGLMLEIRELVSAEQWEKLEMFWAKRKINQRRERRRHRKSRKSREGGPMQPPAPPARP